MKKNLGNTDKIIRVILAFVIAVLFKTGFISGIAGTIALVVSVVLLITVFINFCPLYALFGINTCRSKT